MNEQDREFLSAYLDGELDAAEAARAEAMLQDNPQARAFYDSIDRTRSLVQNLSPAKPPRDLAFSVSRSLLRPRGRVIRMPRLGYAIAACFVLTLGVTVFWIGSSGFSPGGNAHSNQFADTENPSGLDLHDHRAQKMDVKRGRERLAQEGAQGGGDVWALTTDIEKFKGGKLSYAETDVVYDLTTSVSADALYSMLVERSGKDQARSERALAEAEKKYAAAHSTLENSLSESGKARRVANTKPNENSVEDSIGSEPEASARGAIPPRVAPDSPSSSDVMDTPAPAEAPAADAFPQPGSRPEVVPGDAVAEALEEEADRGTNPDVMDAPALAPVEDAADALPHLGSRPEAVLDEAVSEELEEEADLEMDSAYDEGRSGSSRAVVLDSLNSENAALSNQPSNSDDSDDAYDVFVVYVAESQVDELMREFEMVVKEAEAETLANTKGDSHELRLDLVQEGERANAMTAGGESAKEDMKLRWNGGADSSSDGAALRKVQPVPENALPRDDASAGASGSDGEIELGGQAEGYRQAGEAESEQAEKMVKLVIRVRKPQEAAR